MSSPDSSQTLPDCAIWIGHRERSRPVAVALVCHGLNVEPSRMDSVARALASDGVECLRVSLSGHRDVPDAGASAASHAQRRLTVFRSVTRELWLAEMRDAYTVARGRADELRIPLILVGYSLGAVIGCDLLREANVRFDGMILFAPAFRTHWYTQAFRLLRPFPRLTVPSWTPASYRANARTPIAAYAALFESIAAVRADQERQRAVAALIFADPKDGLVSFRQLRALCAPSATSCWQLVPIERSLRADRPDFHHMMTDRDCLGDELWEDVRKRMARFVGDLIAAQTVAN